MTNNPILDELHAVREKLLAESGGTLAGLVNRLQREQKESVHLIMRVPEARPVPSKAPSPNSSDAADSESSPARRS